MQVQKVKMLSQLAIVIIVVSIPFGVNARMSKRAMDLDPRKNGFSPFSSQTHTHTSGNLRVQVRYEKHQLKPLNMFIWLKKVFVNKRKPLVYFKTEQKKSWAKLPSGCPKGKKPKIDKSKLCAEGWKMGKMIARTITYLTIMQGKELTKSMLSGESPRAAANKEKEEWDIERRRSEGKSLRAKEKVDMDSVSDIIINAIQKTAKCIKQGLSNYSGENSVQKMCILKAMKKESDLLIEEIIEGAVLHGFKCDYEALKSGKCRKMKMISREVDQGKILLGNLKSF